MMATTKLDHQFRRMGLPDIEQVLVNERSGYVYPWREGIFRDCIRSGYECWLQMYGSGIVGHGILSIAADEAHLLNVCVHQDYQGIGLGRCMVEYLLEIAGLRKANSIFLEVRMSNLTAFKLYESLGFNEIGVRENYYPASIGREDALVLGKELFPINS